MSKWQGWAQGSFVEAEVKAERARQGSNVLNRGKADRGRELEAEAR